ncbi:MAG: hypothetical protein KF754_14445 [Planctomycetes bacterium]|nr:hypothetical protein [Planctomycetota bacterium]
MTTRLLSRSMLQDNVVDANAQRVNLGDRALDLNTGVECVVLDHCPELGPQSLYVQMTGHEGPEMTYWVEPGQLMKLPRAA